MRDEFYIGWEPRAAPGIGRSMRKVAMALWVLALMVPLVLTVSQRTIGISAFEWGESKKFSGVLRATPYPNLLVHRPGSADSSSAFSTYHLVAPWKFGLAADQVGPLDGKLVSLEGTLIYRDNQTMIEVLPGTISEVVSGSTPPPPKAQSLGTHTFVGEIVDSKCFLGVMNPGQLTPHRACAIRCISGGIPPVLLVRREDESALYLLLVSADGKPINTQVLDMVAEPVEITGELQRQGDFLVLRANPATYRRVP